MSFLFLTQQCGQGLWGTDKDNWENEFFRHFLCYLRFRLLILQQIDLYFMLLKQTSHTLFQPKNKINLKCLLKV